MLSKLTIGVLGHADSALLRHAHEPDGQGVAADCADLELPLEQRSAKRAPASAS
jgi:hypothetical protein